MSILGSMITAVSGLTAQSSALANIANNIANIQTTAYKREDTNFSDLVSSMSGSGSVKSCKISTNSIQGPRNSSEIPTHISIDGQGFFIVKKPDQTLTGDKVFSGMNYYTRRGDFTMDKNGYLINHSGYYLCGLDVDPKTKSITSESPNVIKFTESQMPAAATTSVQYFGNLPTTPKVQNYNIKDPSSWLLNPTVGMTDIIGSSEQAFLSSSLGGGAVTIYDSVGAPANIQMRWAKVSNASTGGAATLTNDTWQLYYRANNTNQPWKVIGTNPNGSGTAFTFSNDGALQSPSGTIFPVQNFIINNKNLGTITFDFSKGLTQTFSETGLTDLQWKQDGYAVGKNPIIKINNQGQINALFNNGQKQIIAAIPLASFVGTEFLSKREGGALSETSKSGSPTIKISSQIANQSLEGSNVDISDQFSKLIITQQSYSANARIITIANEMMRDVMHIIR